MAKQLSDFYKRHIGPNDSELNELLEACQATSLDQLIEETVPSNITLKTPLTLETPLDEDECLSHCLDLAKQNVVAQSHLGQGYNPTRTPSVILRNILENPGWYTQYTPYQAEISQGRLEMLFNFQTLICELTGMDVANASLLDEATAAAEAMALCFRSRPKDQVKNNQNIFVIADDLFPQTTAVIQTRASHLGIKVQQCKIGAPLPDNAFGVLIQSPNNNGELIDISKWCNIAKEQNVPVVLGTDCLAACLLKAPRDYGVQIVYGNTQRFGVPMGYGGPHAAFIASTNDYIRQLPGRIIGKSLNRHGKEAYRMTLQTREQHIRKDKATSNICTAQALLAIMATAYAMYHGPKGLQNIANRIHQLALTCASELEKLGFEIISKQVFDTIVIHCPDQSQEIAQKALENAIEFRVLDNNHLSISFNELNTSAHLNNILDVFKTVESKTAPQNAVSPIDPKSLREKAFLSQEVFHLYHSETAMMRYLKTLENKDLSLTQSMIPLGSCTMKLNAATEMMPLSWPEFGKIHPYTNANFASGYHKLIYALKEQLCKITGFQACSLQPNSGAQGEYAGLLAIKTYHQKNNGENRDTILIPKSAHGTNPATAQMLGFKIKVLPCLENGNIDSSAIKAFLEEHAERCAGLMVTYPSTHGVFEEEIQEICSLVHNAGGLVYMDGANMNAQVGLTNPASIGADVCHLNLHKTFSIPHGGGGPGMGPICVNDKLAPHLPASPIETPESNQSGAVSAAPFGSASILLISYAYIVMMGAEGLKKASQIAILNANYIAAKLSKHYKILYTGHNNRVAHELIIDCKDFKKAGVSVEDVAKRLIDYGFHAPTMSWPVPDTLMIEPTESENKAELDRFINAMIAIHDEVKAIESGQADAQNNVLKNAPHTLEDLVQDEWPHPYSRKEAFISTEASKFWPSSSRVDNAYGDRNLVCSCPALENYETTFA